MYWRGNGTETGEWQVALTKPTQVTVNYQLYANELGQRTRHISSTHAYLDSSSVFMYSPEFRDEKLCGRLNGAQKVEELFRA